ncbi:hypothetical protein [Chryseobacterium sp. MYb328]|uniref:hypothetical protein n=1 Tax=Chryseobacterium sp. MYb328 TaxID=2745231 RepID=UPI003099A358
MKITIPKPCHENWDNMTSDEKGKFCSVCSKTVHDFTGFSNEELSDSFDSNENICGRFREDQLDRNLYLSIISKLALGLLTVGGMLTQLNAQEIKSDELKISEPVRGLNMTNPRINDTVKSRSFRIGAPASIPTEKPLILLNNKEISIDELGSLKPDRIESVNSFLPAEAVKRYGKNAKNGVVVITTKKK